MKNIFLSIFIVILGTFIFAVGTNKILAYTYNARDVSYRPSNESFDVNNVKSALDSIQTNFKSEISSLTSENESKDSTISSLQTQIANAPKTSESGTFSLSANSLSKTVNLGFKPTKVMVFILQSTQNWTMICSYDTSAYKDPVCASKDRLGETWGTGQGAMWIETANFIINNNGFTFSAVNDLVYGQFRYYAIK